MPNVFVYFIIKKKKTIKYFYYKMTNILKSKKKTSRYLSFILVV